MRSAMCIEVSLCQSNPLSLDPNKPPHILVLAPNKNELHHSRAVFSSKKSKIYDMQKCVKFRKIS